MEKQTQKKRNTRKVIYAGIIFLCVSAAMIIIGKVTTFRTDELTLARQMRQQRLGKDANNAPRTVTPRAAVSQISIERTKLLQKLEILKQKRKAKWAEIESAEPTGDGRGVLRLVRLGQEHSDIMDEIQELKRQINKMGERK